MPIKRETSHSFLFPFRWIVVGLIGVTLDIAKTPGYAFGSLLSPFLKKISTDTLKQKAVRPLLTGFILDKSVFASISCLTEDFCIPVDVPVPGLKK